jgi:hypothetical protein
MEINVLTSGIGRPAVLAALLSAALPVPSSAQTPASPEGGSSTGPISGYMELHFNNPQDADPILDFHRFVLLFMHSFSPRIRFVGELELEHAVVEGLEEKGELELEQAYVDFLLNRAFNVRAGMVLVPVGLINERHEPPTFHGVERPLVDEVIVPSTWFEPGAGVHGEIGAGLRYRAFVLAPLDSAGFSADEGLREGRQKGSEAIARKAAGAARVEYHGLPGVHAGASVYYGDSAASFLRFNVPTTVIEADARHRWRRFEHRGQYAHVFVDGAGDLNQARARLEGVDPNVARQMRGFYLESAVQLVPAPPREVRLFLRYENADTQYRMPTGYLPIDAFDRSAWVVGATYYPDPDIAVKLDYIWLKNRSDVERAPNSFNVGIGWWF